MMDKVLTDAELMLLGLVAEMPRHGYELEQIIEERGMRSWAQIGFSSIYFVLGKLEKFGLVTAEKPKGAKAKKRFSLTEEGAQILRVQSLAALENTQINQSGLLLGMFHWPFLCKTDALAALATRAQKLRARIEQLERERFKRQPLPDHVDLVFDYAQGQAKAELDWIGQTKAYFETKIELEEE